MSKLDYTLLFFVAVLLFGVFCVWFNSKITVSNVGKRITWYLAWASLSVMTWSLLVILIRVGNLKGD